MSNLISYKSSNYIQNFQEIIFINAIFLCIRKILKWNNEWINLRDNKFIHIESFL